MTGLGWADTDGDCFDIQAFEDPMIVAKVRVYSNELNRWQGVYVDEGDALALIDWLQKRIEQASSTPQPMTHTGAQSMPHLWSAGETER